MKLFKIKTWVNAILICLIIFVAIRFIIPGYPTIDKKYSISQVKKFILVTLRDEASNISFQNLDSSTRGGAPVKYIKASERLVYDLERCGENKECLINTYNDFMGDNVSIALRKKTRIYYMLKKFGIFGEQLNKSLGFMY